MKKMRTMLVGACALLFTSLVATPSIAGSDDFAGPYVAIQGSMHGAIVNGNATNSNDEITTGTIGDVFGAAGFEAGYLFPAGDNVLLGINVTLQPGDGKISIDSGAGDSADEDITLSIGDVITASIMPMFSVSENSAVFVRVGMTHADLSWTGDIDTSLNSSMKGETYSVGSRTLYGPGLFIDTEFGVSDFDKWSVYRTTGTGSAEGSPETAFGRLAIGFRF